RCPPPVPRFPYPTLFRSGRSVFLEIRAGTGGDESALFAGDLLRMYSRYAEEQGWRVELMSESPSEIGGYKEVIARIDGDGVYGRDRKSTRLNSSHVKISY